MNINLIYQNNTFNFDLRKDISIKYLEDLASKLINKDKSSFELLYKDNILSEHKNSLLKDIVETENNILINITTKNPTKLIKTSKKVFPKIKFKNNNNKESNDLKNNLLLNETEISQSLSENSLKTLQNLPKHNFKCKKNEYITQNKVFEEIYNAKDNEIYNLMKNLSHKIKEYDDVLYKNYKNNYNYNKSELIIFEKNIINFKDKQIKYLKKLINFFEPIEKNDFSSQNITLDLDELYNHLNSYNNKDYYIQIQNNNINNNYNSYNNITEIGINKKEKKMLSPIKEKSYANSNKELPLIVNNKIKKDNKLYYSEKRNNNNNKDEKKDKSLFFLQNRNNKLKLKNDSNTKENLYQSMDIKEQINKENDKKKINESKNSEKKNSIGNTTKANTNQSENSNSSKLSNRISNIIIPKKINITENNNNNNQNKKSSRNKKRFDLFKRVNTIQNINYNKNKVSTLFEISESFKKENKESESDRYKNNISESKSSDDKDSNEINKKEEEYFNDNEDIKKLKKNLNEKKSINYSLIKNSKIGYLIKAKNRKVNQRIKKLGSNPNDFLI